MKILQVNKLYSPWVGGVEKVVQDIAEGLKDKVDMKVLVCQKKGKTTIDNVNGIEVVRAGSIGIYFSMPVSFSFSHILKEMSKDRDILHFHLPFPLGDMAYFLSKLDKKIVLWWHSDIVRQKMFLKLYAPYLRKFLRAADKIIVATPRHIESSSFLKEVKEKCVVIPFGIRMMDFQIDDPMEKEIERIRNKYNGQIILYVGRLVYYKGVEYLINAMKDVNATLLIVGQGYLENSLRQMAIDLRINDRIVFLKDIADKQLKALYHACDIFVLPSIANSEAFGIVQMEAMACAKPVINTDLPTGVPWVSRHEESGITVPPEDSTALANALNTLLNNTNLCEKYGQNARKRVEKEFTIELMLEKVLSVYRNVVL